MSGRRIYFPGLNGLRFIAAFAVIIHHTEDYKKILGFDNYMSGPVGIIGRLGVVLFFVLSGFLITYLLLEEKHRFKIINIKKFYFRRLLRIWPLYFLIITLGLFVYPNIEWFHVPNHEVNNSILRTTLYYSFLPNLAILAGLNIPFISLTWSVGVEEQFYLIWPLVMRYCKISIKFFVIVLSIIMIIYAIFNFIGNQFSLSYVGGVNLFLGFFQFNSMIIGAIFAILLHEKRKIIQFFYKKSTQILTYNLLIIQILCIHQHLPFAFEVYSLLFAIIILNLSSNPKSIFKLESKIFSFFGKISYGLYMFHPIIVFSAIKLIGDHEFLSIPIVSYIVILTITTLIASLSYYLFESQFLILKSKYQLVKSNSNGNE